MPLRAPYAHDGLRRAARGRVRPHVRVVVWRAMRCAPRVRRPPLHAAVPCAHGRRAVPAGSGADPHLPLWPHTGDGTHVVPRPGPDVRGAVWPAARVWPCVRRPVPYRRMPSVRRGRRAGVPLWAHQAHAPVCERERAGRVSVHDALQGPAALRQARVWAPVLPARLPGRARQAGAARGGTARSRAAACVHRAVPQAALVRAARV